MMSTYRTIIRRTAQEETQPAGPCMYPAVADDLLLIIRPEGQEEKRGRTAPNVFMCKTLIQQQRLSGEFIPADVAWPDRMCCRNGACEVQWPVSGKSEELIVPVIELQA